MAQPMQQIVIWAVDDLDRDLRMPRREPVDNPWQDRTARQGHGADPETARAAILGQFCNGLVNLGKGQLGRHQHMPRSMAQADALGRGMKQRQAAHPFQIPRRAVQRRLRRARRPRRHRIAAMGRHGDQRPKLGGRHRRIDLRPLPPPGPGPAFT